MYRAKSYDVTAGHPKLLRKDWRSASGLEQALSSESRSGFLKTVDLKVRPWRTKLNAGNLFFVPDMSTSVFSHYFQ